jgi:hypothetical protein
MRLTHIPKLYRAFDHLNRLEQDMDAWIKEHPVGVTDQLDPKTGQQAITVAHLADPPDRFSLGLGDCIHNMRSSLDHLVFELTDKHLKGAVPPNVARKCEFPIFGDRAPNPKEIRDKIGSIDPAAQTIIEGLQPHLRGDPGYEDDLLWVLHRLDIIDKHQTIPLTVLNTRETRVTETTNASVTYFQAQPRLMELGAEVARYAAQKIDKQQPMNVNLYVPYYISFSQGQPADSQPVIASLRRIYDYIVRDVIGPLVPFLI